LEKILEVTKCHLNTFIEWLCFNYSSLHN